MCDRERYVPGRSAFVAESYGFLWWQVHHDESVSPSLTRILNCFFLPICEHGIVIPYRMHSSERVYIDGVR